MFLIGLTGGIAAGKSTIAKFWSSLGALEIDADVIAREVVEKGTVGLERIVAAFGKSILAKDGSLNRAKLAKLVFSEPKLRQQLESIVHPLVQERTREILSEQPESSIVVYNVPLLVEAKVGLPFNAVVSVEAPKRIRLERLVSQRGFTKEEALIRIESQASESDRANRADYVLNSDQDLGSLLEDAKALWNTFEKAANGTN
jgi:dephospho-CoA kinase